MRIVTVNTVGCDGSSPALRINLGDVAGGIGPSGSLTGHSVNTRIAGRRIGEYWQANPTIARAIHLQHLGVPFAALHPEFSTPFDVVYEGLARGGLLLDAEWGDGFPSQVEQMKLIREGLSDSGLKPELVFFDGCPEGGISADTLPNNVKRKLVTDPRWRNQPEVSSAAWDIDPALIVDPWLDHDWYMVWYLAFNRRCWQIWVMAIRALMREAGWLPRIALERPVIATSYAGCGRTSRPLYFAGSGLNIPSGPSWCVESIDKRGTVTHYLVNGRYGPVRLVDNATEALNRTVGMPCAHVLHGDLVDVVQGCEIVRRARDIGNEWMIVFYDLESDGARVLTSQLVTACKETT